MSHSTARLKLPQRPPDEKVPMGHVGTTAVQSASEEESAGA